MKQVYVIYEESEDGQFVYGIMENQQKAEEWAHKLNKDNYFCRYWVQEYELKK